MPSKGDNKMKKLFNFKMFFSIVLFSLNNLIITFATSPDKPKVESFAVDGIEMFFGALSGIAVVFGGMEFVQAFLAYRESDEEGGSGEANARVGRKILSGIFCLIGAVIVFTIMNWTKALFNLD